MFELLPSPGRKRWSRSMLLSSAAHAALLLIVLHRPPAAFVTPADVALGLPHSSGSLSITYIAPLGPEQRKTPADEPKLSLRATVSARPKPHPPERKPQEPAARTADNAQEQTARGGSPYGRVPGSPLTGDEVVPAFPDVFPDPPISHSDLPAGIQGDVVVEVTIDSQGNVVQMKLLQGIGYGIEQKVLDVLQHWHFHPAMRDGVTIASQHLVHFHYPS